MTDAEQKICDQINRRAEAVRLTADAVVQAAEAWMDGPSWKYEDALGEAVLAHRKAKAEQAKELR